MRIMTLMVLNSLMFICVDRVSRNEANFSTTFGIMSAVNHYME